MIFYISAYQMKGWACPYKIQNSRLCPARYFGFVLMNVFTRRYANNAFEYPVESRHIIKSRLIRNCRDAGKIVSHKFLASFVHPHFI